MSIDLVECVARLIAPYAMWTEPSRDSDSRDWLDWHFLQPRRERSLEAARRVTPNHLSRQDHRDHHQQEAA